jgi:hypothetical protein
LREGQSIDPQATAIARRYGLSPYELEDMVRTGVAFDWPSRYVEDEPAAGVCPRSTVIVSPSVTPTTRPVKSSARGSIPQKWR